MIQRLAKQRCSVVTWVSYHNGYQPISWGRYRLFVRLRTIKKTTCARQIGQSILRFSREPPNVQVHTAPIGARATNRIGYSTQRYINSASDLPVLLHKDSLVSESTDTSNGHNQKNCNGQPRRPTVGITMIVTPLGPATNTFGSFLKILYSTP